MRAPPPPLPPLPPTPRPSMAGGFPVAVGAVGGAGVGFMVGQPTACFFIGIALGIAAAIAIWLIDRR